MSENAAESRQRLVAGAADMMRRRGLNATSVRELAKHAQAPLGSTYHYFPGGKYQLAAEAVAQRRFDKFWAEEEAWIRKGIEARRTRNEGRVKRLERLRDAPAELTIVALAVTVIVVIAVKAWSGRGTPLRGGLPSGHAAIAFAAWIAATYIAGRHERFLVSTIALVMALLVAQTRVESGVHSAFEVLLGGLVGALVALTIFQLA